MEIGTAKGGTLFSFCKLAGEDAIIISIDLPKGLYGDYPKWRTQIYKAFAKGKQKLYLLRRDSHQQETLEEVKKILNGKLINFLFIDADHSYDGVKKDYEMYGSLVKQGGIIAFHDIVKSPPEMQCFVYDFWEEIKKRYIYKEIIKDKNQNWRGIGILFI
jgi:cephalosporin hydroxylase